jgi:hypothetical protein
MVCPVGFCALPLESVILSKNFSLLLALLPAKFALITESGNKPAQLAGHRKLPG